MENNPTHKNGDGITVLMNMIPSAKVLPPGKFADIALFLKQNWAKVSNTSVNIRNKSILKVICFLEDILREFHV